MSAMDALASGIRTFVVTGPFTAGQARKAKRAFAREGFPDADVTAKRIIRLEGCDNPGRLMRLFANPAAGERVEELEPEDDGKGIEIAYRLSVIDPETQTGLEVAKHLGVNLDWLRMGWRYEVADVDTAFARKVIETNLCNPVVEVVVTSETYHESLRPTGTPEPTQYYDLAGMSELELESLSQQAGWYATWSILKVLLKLQQRIGRPLTDAEVEMVVQTLGDHCFHTTWKGLGLLKKLMLTTRRINHPLCRSIFFDNAGAIGWYEGMVIFIKGETHNHPSSIATFGGIQTKHGGLFRDLIFMMKGGYPLGCSTIMGTRLPSEDPTEVPAGALSGRTIVTESIEGTRTYCNPMGVPMMFSAYRAHSGFTKCLALGVGIGFAPEDSDKEEPRQGDVLILIGGSTGRDGVHGATASSADLTAEMVKKEGATVQIGEPITEQQFKTLMPVLRDKKLLRWVTDLGAGGLSCAVGETVAKCGADVCLDGLPLKDESLASWEKWVSESQERGLLVADPRHVKKVLDYCRRYGVQAFVLGTCRSDRRLTVTDHGQTIVDLDLDFLWKNCPIDKLTVTKPDVTRRPLMLRRPVRSKWPAFLGRIVSDYACCDQSLATTQFDSTVQGRTALGPLINGVPSDAFVCRPLRTKPYGAVSSFAFNPRWSQTDPVGSAASLPALAISRAIAVGVAPRNLVLCGNWYTPTRTPEQRWYLKKMVERLCRFTFAVGIPVVSGKDSSSATFKTSDGERVDAPLTLVPSTLGRLPDVSQIRTKVFKHAGDSIYLVHPRWMRHKSMAGSVVASVIGEEKDARLPSACADEYLLDIWREVATYHQRFASIAAIGEGGAFLQLFHGCLASGLGAEITVDGMWELLGEAPGSFLISVAPENARGILRPSPQMTPVYLGQITAEPGILIDYIGSGQVLGRETWPALVGQWRSRFPKEVAR